jgi:hypothetical protein
MGQLDLQLAPPHSVRQIQHHVQEPNHPFAHVRVGRHQRDLPALLPVALVARPHAQRPRLIFLEVLPGPLSLVVLLPRLRLCVPCGVVGGGRGRCGV